MFNAQLIQSIREKLEARQETVAVAESVTAGFLQAALASAEKATSIFQGGITAYNIGQKCRHLDVDPIHAQSCNCVSERMARDMASSVCRQFTCHWGIAVTGYATPVPESGGEVFAYFSIAYKSAEVLTTILPAGETLGQEAQLHYVESILSAFLNTLTEKSNH